MLPYIIFSVYFLTFHESEAIVQALLKNNLKQGLNAALQPEQDSKPESVINSAWNLLSHIKPDFAKIGRELARQRHDDATFPLNEVPNTLNDKDDQMYITASKNKRNKMKQRKLQSARSKNSDSVESYRQRTLHLHKKNLTSTTTTTTTTVDYDDIIFSATDPADEDDASLIVTSSGILDSVKRIFSSKQSTENPSTESEGIEIPQASLNQDFNKVSYRNRPKHPSQQTIESEHHNAGAIGNSNLNNRPSTDVIGQHKMPHPNRQRLRLKKKSHQEPEPTPGFKYREATYQQPMAEALLFKKKSLDARMNVRKGNGSPMVKGMRRYSQRNHGDARRGMRNSGGNRATSELKLRRAVTEGIE